MIPLYVFPLSVAILTTLFCFVPYSFAVYYGHVNWWLPYVSDAGGNLPQSSLYGQLLDITAIMVVFSVFIEYKRLGIKIQRQISDTKQTQRLNRMNKMCFVLSFFMAFGLSLAGNYRITEAIFGYSIGAALIFVSSFILPFQLAFLSLTLSSNESDKRIAKIKIFIAVFINITLILSGISGMISIKEVGWAKASNPEFRLHWSSADPDYFWHCSSTFFEWSIVLCRALFFATFVPEFKRIDWKSLRQTNDNNNELKTIDSNDKQII